MTLSLDASAVHWLADKGYDPIYGARPLKRVIQKDLIDPIARKLLAGEFADGAVIEVSGSNDGLEIGKAQVHWAPEHNHQMTVAARWTAAA